MKNKDCIELIFGVTYELNDQELQQLQEVIDEHWTDEKEYKDKSKLNIPILYNKQEEKEIVDKFNELYIMTRYKHLKMLEDGMYTAIDTIKRPFDNNGRKTQPLHDGKLQSHLRGGCPIGIFAGEDLTKVIIFDVDQTTREAAEEVTYKVVSVLIELGIKYEDIHISDSGNKGYHVDLLLDGFISNQVASQFYNMVIERGNLSNIEGGEVEFRPKGIKQGVKLPLGIHQKTKRRCWFVDLSNKLEPIKDIKHILSIQQMNHRQIINIVNENKEAQEKLRKSRFKFNNKSNGKITEEDIQNTYKPLKQYEQNVNEKYTVDYIMDIYQNGIKHSGSRHNCLFMLAKYFKCEYDMNKKEIKEALTDWMLKQDEKLYSTPIQECLADIEYLSDYVHDKNIQMTISGINDELVIYKSEMDKIMTIEEKIGKLVLFAMIGHSKRYKTKDNEFYMTYNQIMEMTGIGSYSTVKKYIDILHELNYIHIVSRNKIVRDSDNKVVKNENGAISKYPNRYKITLNVEIKDNEESFNISSKNVEFKNNYYQVACQLYSNKELKLICQDRQYREFTKYRKGKLVV